MNIDFFSEENSCKIIQDSLAIVFPENYRDMPLIQKQNVDVENLKYIGFQNTRKIDTINSDKTVGFFMQDEKFERVIRKPWNYVERFKQYKQIMSLDVSCYTDMSVEEQWYNTFLNRLIGKYWQSCGLKVIPTVAWSDEKSYKFAFGGIEEGCVVSVSTIGTHKHYELFMSGYVEMCKKIKPKNVICYCNPYEEMSKYANIIYVEYEGTQAFREAQYKIPSNQLTLFDLDCNFKEVV
jgi:hypothetical protein